MTFSLQREQNLPLPPSEGGIMHYKNTLIRTKSLFVPYNLPFHSYNPCLRPKFPLLEGAGGGFHYKLFSHFEQGGGFLINYFSYRERLIIITSF